MILPIAWVAGHSPFAPFTAGPACLDVAMQDLTRCFGPRYFGTAQAGLMVVLPIGLSQATLGSSTFPIIKPQRYPNDPLPAPTCLALFRCIRSRFRAGLRGPMAGHELAQGSSCRVSARLASSAIRWLHTTWDKQAPDRAVQSEGLRPAVHLARAVIVGRLADRSGRPPSETPRLFGIRGTRRSRSTPCPLTRSSARIFPSATKKKPRVFSRSIPPSSCVFENPPLANASTIREVSRQCSSSAALKSVWSALDGSRPPGPTSFETARLK